MLSYYLSSFSGPHPVDITSFRLNYIVNINSYPNIHEQSINQRSFNEWLAGFIDGDGYFYLRFNKCPTFSIEQELKNLSVLLYIQSQIGGTIHRRKSRHTTYVYTLAKRSDMIALAHRINGHIRNSLRIPQFNTICYALDIVPLPIEPLTLQNAWFTGFFDADGHISGYFTKTPYIVMQVTNKYKVNLDMFVSLFGGNIYHSKGNDVYK